MSTFRRLSCQQYCQQYMDISIKRHKVRWTNMWVLGCQSEAKVGLQLEEKLPMGLPSTNPSTPSSP
jgi:hypothetical protein